MDAAELSRVGRSRAVSRARSGRARASQLLTVYYDTADALLWRNGVSLRLRRSGRRWTQTVKGAGTQIGGLHSREEFEWPVAGGAVDVSLLSGTPFAKLFSRPRVLHGLAPVFETDFRRVGIGLDLAGGTRAMLCLDAGELRAAGATEPLCEAEIELVEGQAQALLDFADELLSERAFRIGTVSKAERGYALAAGGAQAGPAHAGRIDMAAGEEASTVFGRLVQSSLAQVLGNERGFQELADPEYLHQLRVGLRRLRVALSLPREETWQSASRPLRDRLGELSRLLGEARNWDVFSAEVLKPMAANLDTALLAGLRSRAGGHRAAASANARAAMRSAATTRVWLDLGRLMLAGGPAPGGSARSFAADALDRCQHRLVKAAADCGGSPESLHRLRIAAKKLRYVCEFFAGLYPRKRVKRYLAALAALQDELGAVNDAAICAQLVAKADAGAKPLAAESRGLAMGWIAAGAARAAGRAQAAIPGPVGARAFWR